MYSYPLRLPVDNPLVTITNPQTHLWVIELHNGQDNRLTTTLVNNGLRPALDTVEKHWRERWRKAFTANDREGGRGALIIVGRRDQDKFFSNGLDYERVRLDPNFFPETFNPLLARLLLFPIPTIAAINGHCYAGGFMLSLACDYRVMTDGSTRNAWLCMNEVHFGAVWPLSFAAIVRAKFGDHRLHRKIALEGHRFIPTEALTDGILDHLVTGNTAAVLSKAEEVADNLSINASAGVWGLIKSDIYRDAVETIKKNLRTTNPIIEDDAAKARL
ncbi:ClpP/crotonase [Macrolepiota fuliginosa MF-IS2]|uniref:ClpP/crotonase n=1 Tax=Macrolepiota fuliginosa MF-IS2 TaxID=1400762 RepID=A0A9P5XL69_9AGAR|nr:ClpP/crotonase [Macrolepiota fuliginosa MF-IS2]